jgi:N-methylhydantoinase B
MRRYMHELQSLAERLMRAEIAALPDGSYAFEDWIDGVGEEPEPLRIAVEVRIDGDEAFVDFAGTAPQVAASVNCPVGMVNAAVYCAFRGIASREIPNAGGYMRPIHVEAPPGTIVNPVLPAACGARGVIGYRVYDALMGAFAQVVPDKVVLPGEGGPSLVMIGGYQDGKPFVLAEVIVGCWGARAGLDGLEGVSNPLANLSNQPVEMVESELPLRVHRYGLVPDSGGAGRFRGGLAYERAYELLADEAVLTIRSDRRAHRPWGLAGGEPGAPSSNVVRSPDGTERTLPTMPMEAVKLRRGDVFHHVSAGGGGYGDPHERDPERAREDVLDGKVTAL